MDDDFDDFTGDFGGDDLLDFELDTQFRSRAYTWPSRPPTFPPPVIHTESSFEQSQLTPLRNATEAEVAQLQSFNDGNQNSNDLPPSPGGVGAVRKVASRRNAWGNNSYADLISKAIESSPEKRLTLSQIYAWMVANVPFFSDKGDSNSSAGWKNSIRHNLSLHSRFVRVQNEGTGKSSWWMLSSDDVPKAPRKRAGTIDVVSSYRRPGKIGKQLSGRSLKSARSIELHPSGSDALTSNEELRKPFGAVPALNEPISASGACERNHSFRDYRHRSHSGEGSVGSGCSPKFESVTPGNWDKSYLSSEYVELDDMLTGGTSSSNHQQSQSLYQQHHSNHKHSHNYQVQNNEQQILQTNLQQQHTMFRPNEAYAHGVPIHRPAGSAQLEAGMSPTGMALAPGPGYPSSGGNLMVGADVTSTQQHVPILSKLLHEKPRSSCVLGSLLLSGGNMSMQESSPGIVPSIGADVTALLPTENATHPTTHLTRQQQHQMPARRPSQMNQRLLMQLLANKPHLAARVQQLIEVKRRQQMASTAESSQTMIPTSLAPPETAAMSNQSAMLEQLLSGITSSAEEPSPAWNLPHFQSYDESFPNDLDLNLLDFETTSDIDCDIEQVIQHELAFGDKLDFTFDQLHLDEFASYP